MFSNNRFYSYTDQESAKILISSVDSRLTSAENKLTPTAFIVDSDSQIHFNDKVKLDLKPVKIFGATLLTSIMAALFSLSSISQQEI